MTVRGALFCKRRRLCCGQVLQPLGCVLRSTRANVHGEIRFAANLVEEVHELVRAECVWLDNSTPIGVEAYCSFTPDTFPPVVLIGEATTRPANVWYLYRSKRSHDVVTDAASIRDSGIWTNPDSLVNAGTEMLGELAEDISIDLRAAFGGVDAQFNFLWRCYRSCERHIQGDKDDEKTHEDQRRCGDPRHVRGPPFGKAKS